MAGGSSCTVPRGTALAALAGVRRAHGPAFTVTDDGGCGALYVRKIGKYGAHGVEGWVYKVGKRAGTSGAADPAGPFGTGRRIAAGSRVMWFWCRVRAGGCQRTLAVHPARATLTHGSTVRVAVRSYDDYAHGKATAGAKISLGGHTAVTNASGLAVVTVPAKRGVYRITAAKAGMVPPYPERVEVK
jgi:hypothetical protein